MSFENHKLNDMIDLVHHANPADLEHASDALGKATKAINDAAAELRRHLKYAGEDWKGLAGEAFEKWGKALASHTEDLATYADNTGTQIAAASAGLASVRSSMPPRDTRAPADQKTPGQLPSPEQVMGNKDYAEAVRVEQDRQEAINQVNRLASYYSVSGEQLSRLEPPVFEAMPDVGMPEPGNTWDKAVPDQGVAHSTSGSSYRAVASVSENGHVTVPRSDFGHSPLHSVHSVTDSHVELHHPTVSTEINSVQTLPQEAARSVAPTPPSTTTDPNGRSGGTFTPLGTGAVPYVVRGPVGRAVGLGRAMSSRAPASAEERIATPEGTTAEGRGARGLVEPVGRASTIGQQGARRAVSATDRSLIGRGVTGGMPKASCTESPQTGGVPGGRVSGVVGQPVARTGPGATGAVRTGGVVGGKPTAEASPSATGARIPRGTVIGGDSAPGGRATGERPGQRGVIDANNPVEETGQGQSPCRSPRNADGVVGAPTGRVGVRGNGVASGSSALARGSMRDNSPDCAADRGTRRQQHTAEDKKRSRADARRDDAPSATD